MRYFSLFAIGFMLALCGNSPAQQTTLVEHNDKNDPCRRFKMRILVPADADHELPVKRFAGGLDAGIVWGSL